MLQQGATWIALGFALGAIPFGLIVAHLRGVDLRATGSGNIGATNATRAMGKGFGALVLLLDAAKGFVPATLAAQPWALGDDPQRDAWLAGVAVASVLGHVYSPYVKFRGGKGVATALGVFAALSPVNAGVALVTYVAAALLTRVSALGSLAASAAFCVGLYLMPHSEPTRMAGLAVALLILWRHRSNLRELLDKRAAN